VDERLDLAPVHLTGEDGPPEPLQPPHDPPRLARREVRDPAPQLRVGSQGLSSRGLRQPAKPLDEASLDAIPPLGGSALQERRCETHDASPPWALVPAFGRAVQRVGAHSGPSGRTLALLIRLLNCPIDPRRSP